MKRIYLLLIVLLLGATALFCAEPLKLDIIFSNDVHGGIDRTPATFINPDFPPMLGGGGTAATVIKEYRAQAGPKESTLLFDVGDFFQGHPVGSVTKGKAIINYYNEIGYDAMALGNHDYDAGEASLISTLNGVKFPILSANIVYKDTGKTPPYIRPYIIIERLGIKIGIIGLTTTDTEKMSFPENIKNLDFVDEKDVLNKYIPIVKAQGADLVFVLGHMGLPYDPEPAYQSRYNADGSSKTTERYWGYDAQELAHEVNGIDLFLGGHMHKGFAKPWSDPITHTLVLTGYAYGSNLGIISLKIDPVTKKIEGYDLPAVREGSMITLFDDEFLPDEQISNSIKAEQKIAEKGMDEIIGSTSVYLSKENVDAQSLIGNMCTDAMTAEVNADFGFLNLGGVRGQIPVGPITYRQVFDVMPFDNQIVTFTCNGVFLKKIIETRVAGGRHGLLVSGANVIYNKSRPDMDRVTELYIDGKPWDPNKMYKVATTDFLMQGNAGLTLLTSVPEDQITNYQTNLRDGIVNYIKKNSPIRTKIDDRWKRDDHARMSAELQKALDSLPK
ncbi:MAG TPA: bifunctional UDP-sugar hydrolase/5'-nucleotidase [Candidatus Cloacimonadota bacterium]|nr:bifunctional UDP-sugar hydrolase/5'-nucleotidase [Candidatus Cloacimonadota bacterium]